MDLFPDDDSRWAAVASRDPAADRAFVYAVRTTGIYCRPVCKARLARRANVVFFSPSSSSSAQAAASAAGYRPCKRCRPELSTQDMPGEVAERKVRAFVAASAAAATASGDGSGGGVSSPGRRRAGPTKLQTADAMARHVGLSKWHFHRVFKRVTGLTAAEYFRAESPGPRSLLSSSSSPSVPSPSGALPRLHLPQAHYADAVSAGSNNISEVATPFDMNGGLDGTDGVMLQWRDFGDDPPSWDMAVPPDYVFPGDTYLSSEDAHQLEKLLEEALHQQPVAIWYATRNMPFGHLILAFREGQVALVSQADTDGELLAMLQDRFPAPLIYQHVSLDRDDRADDHNRCIGIGDGEDVQLLRDRARLIFEMLEMKVS